MRTVYIALSTAAVLTMSGPVVSAADSLGIPQEALDAMEFFAGKW
jgi:hypothetical protein